MSMKRLARACLAGAVLCLVASPAAAHPPDLPVDTKDVCVHDGGWYISGGIGSTTERALDTLVFGSGMFPYPIIPPIPYSAGSNIVFEVEDISSAAPYVINFAFHGAYLIPVAS